jgi:hypothetical protein
VGKSANTGNFAGHSELTHAYCIWFKNMVICKKITVKTTVTYCAAVLPACYCDFHSNFDTTVKSVHSNLLERSQLVTEKIT